MGADLPVELVLTVGPDAAADALVILQQGAGVDLSHVRHQQVEFGTGVGDADRQHVERPCPLQDAQRHSAEEHLSPVRKAVHAQGRCRGRSHGATCGSGSAPVTGPAPPSVPVRAAAEEWRACRGSPPAPPHRSAVPSAGRDGPVSRVSRTESGQALAAAISSAKIHHLSAWLHRWMTEVEIERRADLRRRQDGALAAVRESAGSYEPTFITGNAELHRTSKVLSLGSRG